MKISVNEYKQNPNYTRIVNAVSACLLESNIIEPINIFVKLGYLKSENLVRWKNGEISALESSISCNLSKAGTILRILRYHAHDMNLIPKNTVYKHKGKILRFSKSGEEKIERAYSTALHKITKVPKGIIPENMENRNQEDEAI